MWNQVGITLAYAGTPAGSSPSGYLVQQYKSAPNQAFPTDLTKDYRTLHIQSQTDAHGNIVLAPINNKGQTVLNGTKTAAGFVFPTPIGFVDAPSGTGNSATPAPGGALYVLAHGTGDQLNQSTPGSQETHALMSGFVVNPIGKSMVMASHNPPGGAAPAVAAASLSATPVNTTAAASAAPAGNNAQGNTTVYITVAGPDVFGETLDTFLIAIDYGLMVDADDQLIAEDGFDPIAFKAELYHDVYYFRIMNDDLQLFREQLCNNRLEFSYKGVLHEFLERPTGCTRATAAGFHIESGRTGARSRNPRKYEDDAAVLEKALLTETEPILISRYKFYLAQSYRDCGQSEKALKLYLERAELGGWTEEIYLSLYNAGLLKEKLGHSDVEIIGTYLKAYERSPGRVEPLHALVKYCHQNGKPAVGYLIGKQAITKPTPSSGSSLQSWVYEYGILDEFSVAAYWAGHYGDSLDACLKLLADGKFPADQRARIETNAEFARKKLEPG